MKHKEQIVVICALSLSCVMVVTMIVALVGLFDHRVDNNEIFKMITLALNTIVGAMVGVIAGVNMRKDDEQ